MARKNHIDYRQTPITSMEVLTMRKMLLRKELTESEQRISNIWHKMFAPSPQALSSSPTQRLIAHISSASAMIDGALFGWKLYLRLRPMAGLFRRKKK